LTGIGLKNERPGDSARLTTLDLVATTSPLLSEMAVGGFLICNCGCFACNEGLGSEEATGIPGLNPNLVDLGCCSIDGL